MLKYKSPIMESTALLRHASLRKLPSAAIPVAATRLRWTFSNVSTVRLPKKGNYCGNPNGDRNNICCKYISKTGPGGSPGFDGGISPNAKQALHELLSFSVDRNQLSEDIADIKVAKRRALEKIINGDRVAAEKIMERVYRNYKGFKPVVMEYYAGLALVEILIHMGTSQSCHKAIKFIDTLEQLDQNLPSDSKRILYRAILYTLLDQKIAEDFWKTYAQEVGRGGPPVFPPS